MIKEKTRYLAYGLYKALLWKFLDKSTRRQKAKTYEKYQESIDAIEAYFDRIELPENKEMAKVIKHVRNKGIETVFPYDFIHGYFLQAAFAISYDKQAGMYYAKRKGRRLYLKHDSYPSALNYYWSLIYEQDKKSPHLYVETRIAGDTLFDIGGAEGFFSLDHINDYANIYIFEGDESWIPALRQTFREYESKVHIVEKFVGNSHEANGMVSLDGFVKDYDIDISKSMFIKMDVEGAELDVLKGASDLLKRAEDVQLSVCTYHKETDAIDLYNELDEYRRFKLSYSKGYMILFYMDDIKEPYLRHGVLRAITG